MGLDYIAEPHCLWHEHHVNVCLEKQQSRSGDCRRNEILARIANLAFMTGSNEPVDVGIE